MNIGFDAKRAFHNRTGLGYYSRTLISLLREYFPEHAYYLFNPRRSGAFNLSGSQFHEVLPSSFLHRLFPSAWRSSWVKADLKKCRIDVYHGLSHEIPVGIHKSGIPSVVTIHDLIHERFPEQYNPIDVRIYHRKFLYACRHADKIIAISGQTKKDIIEFYKVDPEKIEVCHQSCDRAYAQPVPEEEKERIREKYGLPARFFLYVGSIIERKNLLNVCRALFILGEEWSIPLVVIGEGGKYKQKVKEFIAGHGLEEKIIFLQERQGIGEDEEFRSPELFAGIYQSATAMVYPSFYEGFGAPVLEALWSRLPVITSNVSSLPEVGGDAACYVDPKQPEEIAEAMRKIIEDPALVASMKEKGWNHAMKSTPGIYANHVMRIYQSLC